MNNPENRLLVVYNTCGLSNQENSDYYILALHTILDQKFDGMKVVFSDCMGFPYVRNRIRKEFRQDISYNLIDAILPVNVTFNHSVLQGIKEWGEFDGYLYIDSGITFLHDHQIKYLYDMM